MKKIIMVGSFALLNLAIFLFIFNKSYGWVLTFLPMTKKVVFGIVFIILVWIVFISYLLPKSKLTKKIGFLSHHIFGAQFYGAIFLLLYYIIRGLLNLTKITNKAFWQRKEIVFRSGLIIIILTIFVTIYGIYNYHKKTKITNYNININKKSDKFEELNIVLLSDIHFGFVNDVNSAKEIVSITNSLEPDIVLVPGDFVNNNLKEVYEIHEIEKEMKKIKSKYGVFASLGNHDAGKQYENISKFIENCGMKILKDSSHIIEDEITLVGRGDLTPIGNQGDYRMDIDELMKDIDENKPLIVLDHQPVLFDELIKNKVDLVVSGHTHGGQFPPVTWITKRMFKNYRGLYKDGSFNSVVSEGTRASLPSIRIGTRNEIVNIKLSFR